MKQSYRISEERKEEEEKEKKTEERHEPKIGFIEKEILTGNSMETMSLQPSLTVLCCAIIQHNEEMAQPQTQLHFFREEGPFRRWSLHSRESWVQGSF